MTLDLLPTRASGAAENMAVDFLLLQRYPDETRARFRHYEWRGPAATFGFGQKIAYVRAQLAALAGDERLDLCRRPTGGGVVDHRDDWTYALVIPRGHALYDARATESYRLIHAALTTALRAQGLPVVLKERCDPACETTAPTVCFVRPELYDVLHETTGAKVAGAAQKRNKHGLLFQGSIARSVLGTIDWDAFEETFTAGLAATLSAEAAVSPWPDFNEDELTALIEQYASPEWLEYR
ncbi:MAG: lipoate--protein ligase family protein [Verrucomicrobia bacterium]|nr:lipoate--protein ligase family protein [Verrucomicrobiota bacterium]